MNLSLLRYTALCAGLGESQPGRVAGICHEQTYQSRETIIRAVNDDLRAVPATPTL